MDNEDKLKLLKLRVLHSFKWENDIIIPLSEEFNISKEEFEEILMNHFDMSELENLHSTFEIANKDKLKRQLHLDLRLYWFSDVLNLINKSDADKICSKLTNDILNGKNYEMVLKEGRDKIINIIKIDNF